MKTSGATLNVVAMAHSELASSCALRPCTFGAAARQIESKTSGTTLNVVAMAHSVVASTRALKPCTFSTFWRG